MSSMNIKVGLIVIFITIPCIILTFKAVQHIMKGLPSGEKVKIKEFKDRISVYYYYHIYGYI